MTPTNQLTCVANATAQPDGRDVPVSQTTDASRNGCFAMEKTIAATTATSCQKTARLVNRIPTSSARTTDAYRSSGLATLLTTAVMDPTSQRLSAKENTESAPSQSSDATTASVFQADGDVVS